MLYSGSVDTAAAKLLEKASGRMATAAVLVFLLGGCLFTAAQQFYGISSLDEAGYGDSYILFDVLHFQKTGVIYRDPSLPPYLPAQYSPFVYIFYSIPGRIATFTNPFFGPRCMSLGAFLLCILLVTSITRVLIPARWAWPWGLLLAGSIGSMRDWPLQLRGDFPGILFDLLAIRLLFIQSTWAVVLAGLCAGLATQFKFTIVTALVAGGLWLLICRRWRHFGLFAAAGAATSVGIYLLFFIHEHRMLRQITALSPGIADVYGDLKLIHLVAVEPLVLLVALAISPAVWRADPRWNLLIIFAIISFSIAAVTDLQVGGNVNYFFETLFAIVPAAVVGIRRLKIWSSRRVGVALFVTALFVLYFLKPLESSFRHRMFGANGPAGIDASNERFRNFENALRGQHIFSTVPRIALLDIQPALMEPYLLSYSERLGKFDPTPILRRILYSEFDVVLTTSVPASWRGVPRIAPDLHAAIVASYRPYCVYSDYLLQLPIKRHDNSALVSALRDIGCSPVVCNSASMCPAW